MGVALAGVALFGLVALGVSLTPGSAALRRWVAAVSMVATHVQTTAIVCSAGRTWPIAVDRTLACSLLAYTCVDDSQCLSAEPSLGLGQRVEAYRQATRALAIGCGAFIGLAFAAGLLTPLSGSLREQGRAVAHGLAFMGAAATCLLPGAALRAGTSLLHLGTDRFLEPRPRRDDAGLGLGLLLALGLLLLKHAAEIRLVARVPPPAPPPPADADGAACISVHLCASDTIYCGHADDLHLDRSGLGGGRCGALAK